MNYSLEELQALANAGLIDWSVVENLQRHQAEMAETRSQDMEMLMAEQRTAIEFEHWSRTQDAMFGSQTQEYLAQLRQQSQNASARGRMRRFFQ